ncbi:MAG: phosphopantetheine--protein transferase [Arthrobacter sp.]|nr:phosphopantetheine--protein transferase [Arthrobacter sp.]
MKYDLDRGALSRVIAVINGKGGVFKTSLVANVGGLLAEGGSRVLLVDLDPQGDLAEDLGYADQGDGGRSLAASLCFGGAPDLLLGVRSNLDVIAGGPHLDDAAAFLGAKAQKDRDAAQLALARLLAEVAGEYDLVLLDCPPGNEPLQAPDRIPDPGARAETVGTAHTGAGGGAVASGWAPQPEATSTPMASATGDVLRICFMEPRRTVS